MLKEGVTWRALDVPGVAWQTVYGYFARWSKSGLFGEICREINWRESSGTRAVDSTCIKVHKDGANPAGGQEQQSLGRTKGGLNTKLHAVVDEHGQPVVLELTAGQAADCSQASCLLEGAGKCQRVLMDKAYDTNSIRALISALGAEACIPSKTNRKEVIPHDEEAYKERHVVENFFEKLKRAKRTGTRYDKLDERFFSFVMLNVTVLYLRGQF